LDHLGGRKGGDRAAGDWRVAPGNSCLSIIRTVSVRWRTAGRHLQRGPRHLPNRPRGEGVASTPTNLSRKDGFPRTDYEGRRIEVCKTLRAAHYLLRSSSGTITCEARVEAESRGAWGDRHRLRQRSRALRKESMRRAREEWWRGGRPGRYGQQSLHDQTRYITAMVVHVLSNRSWAMKRWERGTSGKKGSGSARTFPSKTPLVEYILGRDVRAYERSRGSRQFVNRRAARSTTTRSSRHPRHIAEKRRSVGDGTGAPRESNRMGDSSSAACNTNVPRADCLGVFSPPRGWPSRPPSVQRAPQGGSSIRIQSAWCLESAVFPQETGLAGENGEFPQNPPHPRAEKRKRWHRGLGEVCALQGFPLMKPPTWRVGIRTASIVTVGRRSMT